MLETVQTMQQAVPNRLCEKQTVDPAASNSNTPVDSAMFVYPIYIDYEEKW